MSRDERNQHSKDNVSFISVSSMSNAGSRYCVTILLALSLIGKEEAGRIINEVKDGVKHWKSIATRLGIAKREMDVFEQVYQRALK